MKAEIITIGTELLLGHVVNTNATFLSRELASLGIEVYHQITVGDNADRLKEAIELAESRVDLIILSGGLGPTEDDLTKQTVAEHLGIDLVLHEETENKIISYHKNADFEMPPNNQLQALILAGSTPLANDTGLAVGMMLSKHDRHYVLLPGPPDEIKPMVKNYLRNELVKYLLEEQVLVSRVLRYFGLTEAQLARKIEPVIKKQTNPTAAIYAGDSEITVRITAKAKTETEGNQAIDVVEEEIQSYLSDYFFGYGEKRLADVVKDLLIDRGLTITAAESLTGGAFLSELTGDTSASAILEGGIITYSNEKKNKILKVRKQTIEKFGVVSGECAIEMAEKAQQLFDADIGVGLTGVAGPSSLEKQIPGTVYIGIAFKGKQSFAKHYQFAYKRNRNRRLSVMHALELVRRTLEELPIEKTLFFDKDS
ncbi:Molybdopterin binding motif, CinA N-terminal domain protein [Alkalibacterium sp. AK22]|uniref:competence/damage-inducible protein A n=1 Tax=Alkalibacterium sp. AK22 TaxID=1229520 RepID=UPI000448F3FE|nr:competence/damage-inducible protein A [Alkalibacterium sp. AK22]EXJ22685.1 Molybdopterin binding motif, CinA N-terminal domain protein [Alkalibacterium sp. AK22]